MRRLHLVPSGLMIACMAMSARAENPFDSIKTFSATLVVSGMSSKMPEGASGAKILSLRDQDQNHLAGRCRLHRDRYHRTYYLYGDGRWYVHADDGARAGIPLLRPRIPRSSAHPQAPDTVDGHACKVENMTVTPHSGPHAGQPTKMKVWEAQDLHGFPIKVETQTTRGPMTIEYKDVSFAEPDASLFTHPDNCRQMPGMPAGAPH